MGAWGYDIEDNDTAMDCLCDVEGYVSKNGADKNEAIQLVWLDGYYCKDNFSILMLCKLENEIGELIHKEELIKALKEELQENKLLGWRENEKRKEALLKFAKDMKVIDEIIEQ